MQDNLKFTPPQDLDRRAKPTFEATGYELYYYAADEDDEVGKTMVSGTLDRKQKWDSNGTLGSSTSYEFIGLPEGVGGINMITIRALPCPCHACASATYAVCKHLDICGQPELRVMRLAEPTDCPDILTVPLTEYSTKVLKAFVGLRGGKLSSRITRKDDIIKYIVDNYREYIDLAPLVPNAHENPN